MNIELSAQIMDSAYDGAYDRATDEVHNLGGGEAWLLVDTQTFERLHNLVRAALLYPVEDSLQDIQKQLWPQDYKS